MRGVVGTVLAAVTIGAGGMPAAGAATALAATTPTAPPSYQVVIGAATPVPPGMFDAGAQTVCPAGTVAWGGGTSFVGGLASPGESINTSAPGGAGWEGRYNNTNSTRTNDQFRVDAICARKPAGYTVKFATADNPPGTQSAAVAACPTTARLLSGGTLSTADTTDVQLLSAWPLDRHRFKSVMWNGSATDQRLTTFAICANRPPGYAITSTAHSDPGGPITDFFQAQCPAGTSVVGGGIHVTGPRPSVTVGGSLEEDAYVWDGEPVNSGPAPATVTTYAICAA
jgi:hypothetical protein